MIAPADLDRLLAAMLAAGLEELEVCEGDRRIRLRIGPAPRSVETERVQVLAAAMGTFLDRHPRRPGPPLKAGDVVTAGAMVGYLRCGPTLVPVVAPNAGRIHALEARVGELVGHGAHLLTIDREA